MVERWRDSFVSRAATLRAKSAAAARRGSAAAAQRRGDAIHLLIFDRTSIAKYALDRIISVREANLLYDSHIMINISFAYHLNELLLHSSRSRLFRVRCVLQMN